MHNDLKKKIQDFSKKNLVRERIVIQHRSNTTVTIEGKTCINFCSNDYLGLSTSDVVKQSFVEGARTYGFGSGSSNMVSGYCVTQPILEEKFAEFLGRDKAIFFNTGYLANVGVITALADRHSVIVSDKLCHASLLDGIQLSRATHYRFPHQDLSVLATLLKNPVDLLITESVFSMEGDKTPADQMAALAKAKDVLLIIDDAHGMGVLGREGKGICDHFQLTQADVPCLIVPLGKALGGMGAIVSGDKTIIDAILQFSRSYRFSTALPGAIAHANLTSLMLLQKESWRRRQLQERIHHFLKQAQTHSFDLVSEDPTPIKSIRVGDNKKVRAIQRKLIEQGFFVSCVRPPTVPSGTARIRISLNCFHAEKEINALCEVLARALAEDAST